MTVNIHGKEYKTVAERVNEFRAEFERNYSIETEIISAAEIVQMKATIRDQEGRVISTGFAEEVRGSTNINRTSALENCETSAIGRALASFGFSGSEYASANEVMDAIVQQKEQEVRKNATEFYAKHNKAVFANIGSLEAIRSGLIENDLSSASEAWYELDQDLQQTLMLAPSKGGWLSTKEIATMKTKEFREAYYGENNE